MIYDARDLAKTDDPTKQDAALAGLANGIQKEIGPDEWDAARGSSMDVKNGKLVVVQTEKVHGMIEALLRAKRGLPVQEKAKAPGAEPVKPPPPSKDEF